MDRLDVLEGEGWTGWVSCKERGGRVGCPVRRGLDGLGPERNQAELRETTPSSVAHSRDLLPGPRRVSWGACLRGTVGVRRGAVGDREEKPRKGQRRRSGG